MVVKIAAQIIVIVLNYVISKLIVFKKIKDSYICGKGVGLKLTKDKTNDMTVGNPVSLIIRFMIPMCLGNIFSSFITLRIPLLRGSSWE